MTTSTPERSVIAERRLSALVASLPRNASSFYGLLDAAVDDRLHELLKAEPTDSEVSCLYGGNAAVRYARYAPYLIKLHRRSPVLARWLEEGWTLHWGIFVASAKDTTFTRQHLKKFLSFRSGTQTVHVRYYDPRVLPDFLGSLCQKNGAAFFDQRTVICCMRPDGEAGQQVWRAQLGHGGVLQRLSATRCLQIERFDVKD